MLKGLTGTPPSPPTASPHTHSHTNPHTHSIVFPWRHRQRLLSAGDRCPFSAQRDTQCCSTNSRNQGEMHKGHGPTELRHIVPRGARRRSVQLISLSLLCTFGKITISIQGHQSCFRGPSSGLRRLCRSGAVNVNCLRRWHIMSLLRYSCTLLSVKKNINMCGKRISSPLSSECALNYKKNQLHSSSEWNQIVPDI